MENMKTFVKKAGAKNGNAFKTMGKPASVPILNSNERLEIRQVLRGPTMQPKLDKAAPNNAYEQEADSVAEQMMFLPDPENQKAHSSDIDYRRCELENVPFDPRPQRELFFEAEVLNRLTKELKIPAPWGPKLMWKSNFKRDVYRELLARKPLPRTADIAVDFVKGATLDDSFLLFGLIRTSMVLPPLPDISEEEIPPLVPISEEGEHRPQLPISANLGKSTEKNLEILHMLEKASWALKGVEILEALHWIKLPASIAAPVALINTIVGPVLILIELGERAKQVQAGARLIGIKVGLKAMKKYVYQNKNSPWKMNVEDIFSLAKIDSEWRESLRIVAYSSPDHMKLGLEGVCGEMIRLVSDINLEARKNLSISTQISNEKIDEYVAKIICGFILHYADTMIEEIEKIRKENFQNISD